MPYYRVKYKGQNGSIKTVNIKAPDMNIIEKHYGDALVAVILPIAKLELAHSDGERSE